MAIVFPSLGRSIVIAAITIIVGLGILFGVGIWAEHANREHQKRDIAELKMIFAQMLAEGMVPEPVPGPKGFQVFGSCGLGSTYQVYYLSADGQRHGFSVSTGIGGKPREWAFHYLEEPHYLLSRPRLNRSSPHLTNPPSPVR